MNSAYRILDQNKDSVLVRFETWRYEREEQFALIPLLKTIAFALPDKEKFVKCWIKKAKFNPYLSISFLRVILACLHIMDNYLGIMSSGQFHYFQEFDIGVFQDSRLVIHG
jgi:hypothetical protein